MTAEEPLQSEPVVCRHLRLMVADGDPPVLRRCDGVLFLMVDDRLHGPTVHHDAMLPIPELPGASLVHLAALLREVVVDLRSVGHAVRAPEDLMELSRGQKRAPDRLDPVVFAVGLHLLEREVVLLQDPDQLVLVLQLLLVRDDGLVLFSAQADLLDVVPDRRLATTPEALGRQVVQVVPDPERVVPDLQAGEDHGQVHHRLADRRGRVDPVLHRDELDALLF